jgi:phytoene synthase
VSTDPGSYCRTKAAPEGSDPYYALLFVEPDARAGVLALMALQRELCEAVEDCSDFAVSRRKLQYWSEELSAPRPRHPVAVALRHGGGHALIGAGERVALVQAALARIEMTQVPDETALHQECLAGAGRALALASTACGDVDDAAAASAAAVGAAVEQARLLRLPRRAGAPPHTSVPRSLLGRFDVRPQELDTAATAAGACALRAALLQAARERLQHALAARPTPPRLARCLGRLALARVDAMAAAGFVEDGRSAGITPLRKLWIAWRSAR